MTEEQVFLAALDVPDQAARIAYLDEACGQNGELRRQVEELLAAHERSGQFLDEPAAEQIAAGPPLLTGQSLTIDIERGDDMADNKKTNSSPSDEAAEDLQFLSPSTRPDSLGRLGHYEVLQVLGKGGFGIVFRAFDDMLQRVVAVKVMAPQIATLSPARKRFLREARSSAQVRHENVVHVYEVGEQPLPFLTMEFIPGETLQQKLDRTGPLEVPEVLRIGRQIAEGLAAAHACDLIHRDIKPGNIMLEGGSHKAKITDFGLARAADDASISQSGVIAGTPMYMAPEQAQGQTLDQRADLFSLGSILYQMVAGRPPFRANSAVAVLKRVAEDTPRAIREIIPEAPQWLCDIIAKLHAKNPDDRYQSAREVADVLADCEAQLKAHAKIKDFSRIPRGKPRRSGRRKWVVGAALVLLGLIGIGVAAWKLPGSNPPAGRTNPPADPVTANDLPLADSPTDLIPFARPDLSRGRWESHDGKLVHPARDSQDYPGLTLAVRGPDDFDLEAEFERTSGDDFIAFGMSSRGHLFCVALDTWGQWAGLQAVAGELSNANPTRRMGPWLTTGRRHTFRCEVRASGVRAWLDAREVVDYRGGYDVLSFGRPGLPDWAQFFVQANDNCGFVVHKFVLIPRPPGPPPANPEPLPPTFTNSIGMEFVIVPKGKSWLGGGKDNLGDKEVVIPADFYLGKYEVTQEEWEKVMGYNPSDFSRKGGYKDAVKDVTDADLKRFPVESVSWDQCQLFVVKLNQCEREAGWEYRLPSEEEWEYACRGGPMTDKRDGTFDFYFAKPTNTLLPAQANFNNGLQRPGKVGSYEPNVLGLYDMHGNVGEWCNDPAWVVCGGDLQSAASGCRAKSRSGAIDGLGSRDIGLRLVRVRFGTPAPEAKTPPRAVAPFTDADVQRIAALPAEQQVEEVRKELMRRNPGFDGKMETKIEGGVVTEFRIVTDKVTDIAPIRVFDGLRLLDCKGAWTNKWNGLLADLTPLNGMNLTALTYLSLSGTKVGDAGMVYFKDCKNLTHIDLFLTQVSDAGLVHFKDCKNLTHLYLGRTKLSDAGLANFKDCKNLTDLWINDNTQVGDAGMVHFQGCKALKNLNLAGTKLSDVGLTHFKHCKNLKYLYVDGTQVGDAGLAQLKGMPLRELNINNTGITDLTPLQGMTLEHIRLTPKNIIRGMDVLRNMKSLETIGLAWKQAWPAAEFWQRYDKGEFKE